MQLTESTTVGAPHCTDKSQAIELRKIYNDLVHERFEFMDMAARMNLSYLQKAEIEITLAKMAAYLKELDIKIGYLLTGDSYDLETLKPLTIYERFVPKKRNYNYLK